MENKRKKTIILISIIIVLIIAIIACILIFMKPNNKQNEPNNRPNQSGENNRPNSDNNNTDDKDNTDNENNTENNGDNNSDDKNDNPNGSGDNNQGGTTTPVVKKLRIYSCRRTTNTSGVEIVDSLNLKYHIENGLQSDEVIVTMRATDGSGTATIEAYKKWMAELKKIKGITITTTQSGDKVVFSIKTDYKKVDYSNIDFNDKDRILFYNDIRANDSLETITEFLGEAGYICQAPKEA